MTYTKGKWEAKYRGHGEYNIESRGLILAEVCLTGESLEIVESNARLISAAPDMYEALKNLKPFVEEYLKESGGCDHSVGICACRDINALENAIIAIAKAEGQSPTVKDVVILDESGFSSGAGIKEG